mgnify:FL=1
MKLAPIIECLRENCPAFERRVFGTFAWLNIDDKVNPSLPCAFVLPSGVSSDRAITSTKYRQQITNKFTVVVCVSLTQDDVLGKTGHDYIEELKEQVFHAILGLPLGYPEFTGKIVCFGSQTVNSNACNGARLAENLDFSYDELLTGSITAQARIIDALPALSEVRLSAKSFSATDEDDNALTATLFKASST